MPDIEEVTSAAETPVENVPSWDDTMSEVFDKVNEAPEEAVEAPAEAEDAVEETVEAQEADGDEPEEAEVEETTVDAPDGWSAEMKEKFAALPEEVRDYVAARDKAAHAKLSEQGRVISTLKPVSDTLEQYRHTFETRGLDAPTAMKAMFEVQDRLDRDPANALRQIAQIYNVDMSQFGGTEPQDGNPDTAALRQQIGALEQQLTAIRNETAQDRNARQAQELQESQTRVAEWSKGKPHFEAVRETMGRLIQAGEAADLDSAYDKAIWMNPDIRQEIEAAKAKKAAAEAAKQAEAAKKRQRVNVGKHGDRVAPAKTWEETLAASYDEVVAS